MALRMGTGGSDRLVGTTAPDEMYGQAGNDVLNGDAGDDLMTGGAGDDEINGGTGTDTAIFSGPLSAYTMSFNRNTGVLTITGPDGVDRVKDVERLQFADQTVVWNMGTGAAVGDSFSTTEEQAVSGNVLANDITGYVKRAGTWNPQSMTAQLVSGPANGELTFAANGAFTYTPDADFSGADSFTYRIFSNGAWSAPVTVALNVAGVNDGPDANDDSSLTAVEDTPTTLDVLGNDTDADGDSLTITHVEGQAIAVNGTVTLASGAVVTLNANGTLGYAPALNVSGQDSFTYTVSDGNGGTSTATATATVNVAGVSDSVTFSFGSAGSDVHVNTSTNGTQTEPGLAALEGGGHVVVWTSNHGGSYEVYAQRYDADGNPVGSQTQINTYTASDQLRPAVAGLEGGGYVVTWQSTGQDGSGHTIVSRRFDADGVALGSEAIVNTHTANDQRSPNVIGLEGGGYLVTWYSFHQDVINTSGVYGQFYDASGAKVGGEFRVNQTTAGNEQQSMATQLPDGNIVVVWQTDSGQDGDTFSVMMRTYSASGVALTNETVVNTYGVSTQGNPSVTALSDGRFVVTWNSWWQDGNGYGVYAQVFAADGSKSGSEFRVNTTTAGDQWPSEVVGLNDGGFLLVWNGPDGSGVGVFARRYDADGTPLGDEFRINEDAAGDQVLDLFPGPLHADVTADGDLVVTWRTNGEIYTRTFSMGFAGAEDTAISLPIEVTLVDSSESIVSITLIGVPLGSALSAGTDNGDGTWSLTAAQLSGLTLTPPADWNGSFELGVSVVTQDGDDTETFTMVKTVVVTPVAEPVVPSGPALLVDFEDLSNYAWVSDGYHGFNWRQPDGTTLTSIDGDTYAIASGYNVATADSGSMAAYSWQGPITITRTDGGDFFFDKVSLTSAWEASQSLTVSGWNDGVLVGTVTLNITDTAETLLDVDWGAIDTLIFDNNGSNVVYDDFTYSLPSEDPPLNNARVEGGRLDPSFVKFDDAGQHDWLLL